MNDVMNTDVTDAISEKLCARWSDVGDKIVTMANDFPADRFDVKPTPDVRSLADQLRHIAFWNQYVQHTLQGVPDDGQANELARSAFPTKAKIVAALRQSFAAVLTELSRMNGALDVAKLDTIVSFIQHNGEHYGQLVMYYRLNGMVPPSSR